MLKYLHWSAKMRYLNLDQIGVNLFTYGHKSKNHGKENARHC